MQMQMQMQTQTQMQTKLCPTADVSAGKEIVGVSLLAKAVCQSFLCQLTGRVRQQAGSYGW